MPQNGCRLIHRGCENAAVVRDDAGMLFSLPGHPNPRHLTRDFASPRVLTESAADVVLVEMRLPEGARRDTIYVKQAHVEGQDSPFVTAIWFTPEAADRATDVAAGEAERQLRRLLREWRGGAAGAGVGGADAKLRASGLYTELGLGVLPGKGRTSVCVDGKQCNTPFARAPERSTALEPYLSRVMANASAVASLVLDQEWLRGQWAARDGCAADVARAYQFPAVRPGLPMLSSHQVAMRGPREEEPGKRLTAVERARAVLHSLSDLHTDSMDGGGEVGAATLYSCLEARGGGSRGAEAALKQALRRRDLAALPNVWGGRGVRVGVMERGWQCLVLMRTRECLHGSVFPDGVSEPPPAQLLLPGLELMRIVTYPIGRIEHLMSALGKRGGGELGLWFQSDAWVRSRANDESGRATDEQLRLRHGQRRFTDGVAQYLLTDVPCGVCRRAATLVWRKAANGGWLRHCVVAESEHLRMKGATGEGLYAWRDTVDPFFVWGRYAGSETAFDSAEAAEAYCAEGGRHVYCMPVVRARRSGRWQHVVVDPTRVADAFLKYVNDPAGLGVAVNAQFVLDGTLTADGEMGCYDLLATPAENAAAEIIASYRADGGYKHGKRD